MITCRGCVQMKKDMKKIYRKLILCLSMLLYITTGCNKTKEKIVQQEEYMLGTFIQAKVYDSNKTKAKKSLEKAFKRVEEIEERFSVNIPTSEISQINKNAGIAPTKVDEEVIYLLRKSTYYSKLSQGAFDPTIGNLVQLWGIGTDHAQIPDDESLQKALSIVNFNDLIINEEKSVVSLAKKGQRLDLGAIAKGYAADEMKKNLIEEGVRTAFLNLGGNVLTIGSKPDGSSWKVGIQNPFTTRGNYIGILEVRDQAIVSSGNYERYFEEEGKRYHHILDPRTGYPSNNGIISTTIITNQSIDADALSTAVYVMGLEKGLALINSLADTEAVFITNEKKVYITSGLEEKFHLTNGEFTCEKR